jgi:hypothetical protein
MEGLLLFPFAPPLLLRMEISTLVKSAAKRVWLRLSAAKQLLKGLADSRSMTKEKKYE